GPHRAGPGHGGLGRPRGAGRLPQAVGFFAMPKRVAVIPGDGVGKEVIPVGMEGVSRVLPAVEFESLPWGCEYYERSGRMMPEDGLQTLAEFDAIYLGAIGWPTVPDHLSLWGLLLPIRKTFEQYVNVRPVR